MDNSINNISFKGQLVTKLAGRHNIMSKVAENFANKTRRSPGELTIKRGEHLVSPNTIVFSNGNASLVISDYAKYMGNNLKKAEDVTESLVNKISETFTNIYKALKLENKFVNKNQELIKSINRLKRIIEQNEARLETLRQSNDQKAVNLLSAIIDSNKNKLAKLEAQYKPKKADFLDEADRLSRKDPELKPWRSVVEELESFI